MPGTKGAAPRGLPRGPRRLCLAGSQGTEGAAPGGLAQGRSIFQTAAPSPCGTGSGEPPWRM